MGARSRRTAVIACKVASALSAEIISSYAAGCRHAKNQAQIPSVRRQEQLTVATVTCSKVYRRGLDGD